MKGSFRGLILVVFLMAIGFLPSFADAQSSGLVNLGPEINSPESDFSPIVSPDGNYLFFTSSREGGLGGQDIWVSERVDGEWTKPKNLGEPINSSMNQGADTFVVGSDKQFMYLTYCSPADEGLCDIYVSEKPVNGPWSKPKNVGYPINTPYSDANATWDYVNRTLYFTSSRPGGMEGPGPKKLQDEASYDIWRCKLRDGKWQKPENLGEPINTPKWEGVAFYHSADNSLYFSSNGHSGEGGSDVFRTRETSPGVWAEPEPIDMVNTSGNDTYFTIPAAGDVAFFSSNRPGGEGEEDIYTFPLDLFLEPEVIAKRLLYMPKGFVRTTGPKVTHFENILFDFDKSIVRSSEVDKLNKVADFMNDNIYIKIEIHGHACSVGDDDYNLVLSKNRSESVYKYLMRQKINPDRMEVSYYGETKPAEENDPVKGNPLNRRVVLSIVE
jgi:outer membrane protein OmpA-like peptidoglycan-associated protein